MTAPSQGALPLDKDAYKKARFVVSVLRAAEVGGCFRPSDEPQAGECADGDCYCSRRIDKITTECLTAYLQSLPACGKQGEVRDEKISR